MKKTVIIGNLGQDAQVKTTQQGQQFLGFTVAVSEKRNGQESTTWFSCSAWGERFVTGPVGQYLKKGTKVYLEGNYNPSLFNAQDGSVQISHNFMVNQLELLGGAPQQAEPIAQTMGHPMAQPMAAIPNQAVRTPELVSASQKIAAANVSMNGQFAVPAQQPLYSAPGSGHTDDQDLPF